METNLIEIEVISHCINGEPPRPLRFRTETEGAVMVGKVTRITDRVNEGYMGNIMFLYRCEVLLDGVMKRLELKYEKDTMKWYLYKPGTTQQKI